MMQKLKDYIDTHFNGNVEIFSRSIDRSPKTVYDYLTRGVVPGKPTMKKIVEISKGEIMPNDFYS